MRAVSVSLAVIAALAAFGVVAASRAEVGPVVLSIRIAPALDGGSTLAFPPFGSVSADTHAGPVSATLTLEEVDVRVLQQLATDGMPSAGELDGWRDDIVRGAVVAALRGIAAAALLAMLVAWGLTRSKRAALLALAASVALTGVSLGAAFATFDPGAFNEPTFRGALSYAPGAFRLVQDRITHIEELQEQIGSLATDLAAYYGVDQAYAGGGSLPDTYRVLHVSDLHLDPVGMQLALDLASAYDVALVIDTGDISHFGTEQEAALAVAQMSGRPYVFVPGNHDSPSIVAAIADSGITVLDGETTVTAGGLVILGVGDPAGAGTDVEPDSARAAERGREVADAYSGERPDVVAVHDPAAGRAFAGNAAIVLSGHTHTPALETKDGTVFLGAGTTGGVHFTELRPDPHIPHGAAVLYFSRAEPHDLVAIDQIEVYGKTRQSAIRRTLFDSAASSEM